MGRNKKVLTVNNEKFDAMPLIEKLALFTDFSELFQHTLSKIPYSEIKTLKKGKAETIAEEFYKQLGFEVYRSRVSNGYRCIGVEFYWQKYKDKISKSDKEFIERLKNILSKNDFETLAMMVQSKNGTPDLLLIKDNKISFVEVKYNHETVKPATVEFYLRHGQKWPTSILRVLVKK